MSKGRISWRFQTGRHAVRVNVLGDQVLLTSRPFAVVGLGACLLLLAGFVTSRQGLQYGDRPQQFSATRAADPLVAELAEQTGRLKRGLATVTAVPRLARNPFEAPPVVSAPALPEVNLPPPEVPPPAVAPELTLLGIAEDSEGGVVVRTAIIGGSGDALYFVKPGEMIDQRYRVTRMSSEAAEIIDVGSQASYALVLR